MARESLRGLKPIVGCNASGRRKEVFVFMRALYK
jgi:hypothetical protein